MASFESDYIAGAHPEVLKALCDTNLETLTGYGMDRYCASAREKIRKACACPDAEVEFLVGGTQTNEVVISTMLKDYEGVVAAVDIDPITKHMRFSVRDIFPGGKIGIHSLLFHAHAFPFRYLSTRKSLSAPAGQNRAAAVSPKFMRMGCPGSNAGQAGRVSPWESRPLGSPVLMKLHQ